ncbi:hypothetical protein KJ688_10285 [bacterium]|nr:hypothetical protein [bacterium]
MIKIKYTNHSSNNMIADIWRTPSANFRDSLTPKFNNPSRIEAHCHE